MASMRPLLPQMGDKGPLPDEFISTGVLTDPEEPRGGHGDDDEERVAIMEYEAAIERTAAEKSGDDAVEPTAFDGA